MNEDMKSPCYDNARILVDKIMGQASTLSSWWRNVPMDGRDALNRMVEDTLMEFDIADAIHENRQFDRLEDENRRLNREWLAMEKKLEEKEATLASITVSTKDTLERLKKIDAVTTTLMENFNTHERTAAIYREGLDAGIAETTTAIHNLDCLRRTYFDAYSGDLFDKKNPAIEIILGVLSVEQNLSEMVTILHGAKCRVWNGEAGSDE